MSPKTFDVDSRRAFFNGIGAMRGDLKADQKERFAILTNAQKEVYDALASENPEPFVPVLTDKVFANFFPGKKQTVWTYYNKAGVLKNAPLLAVAAQYRNKRFVELVSDREIPVEDGKISLDMGEWEVGMVAAFDPLLKIDDAGNKLQISCGSKVSDGTRIVYIDGGKKDSKENFRKIKLAGGKGSIEKSALAKGRLIIKLYNNNLLQDETILNIN